MTIRAGHGRDDMARKGADLKKKVDELKRELQNSNRVRLERGTKHTQVRDRKTGRVITTLADTPSDYRSLSNMISKLNKARVFDKGKVPMRSDRFPLPGDVQIDALHLLDILGYTPVPNGKGVFQGGALTQLAKWMMEEAKKMSVLRGRNLNVFQSTVTSVIVNGNMASPETIDIITRAVEVGLATVSDQPLPVAPDPQPEPEIMVQVVEPEPVSAHDISELPKVGYAPIGPLYETENGKVTADSLHIRILAAILDHTTTTKEAMELSAEVANLERH